MSTAGHPFKALCDTSIYIPFINKGMTHPVFAGSARPVFYMSMVVLAKLYAGSHDANSIELVGSRDIRKRRVWINYNRTF